MIGYTVVESPQRTMSAVFLCGRCHEPKSASSFRLPSSGKYCRPCEKQYKREWYEKNKTHVIAKTAAWRVANPDLYKQRNQAYYRATYDLRKTKVKEYALKNRERENRRKTAWRRANLEKQRLVEERYRTTNRDACNGRIKTWKRLNRDRVTIYTLVRGKGVKQATPSWANFAAIKAIYQQAASMRQSGQDVHVDHIVPIFSKKVCGLHWEGNLRIVPRIENLKKCNYHWPDMP